MAIAIIEAKAENLSPTHGLEQAKAYADCKRMNVQFVYSSGGHRFVEFDRTTQNTTQPKPMAAFPTHDALQKRYEEGMGFNLDEPVAKPLLEGPGTADTKNDQQITSEMTDFDLFDVLADLGCGLSPKTSLERVDAFQYKHSAWLKSLPSPTHNTLQALVKVFGEVGIGGLEKTAIFRTPQIIQAGSLKAQKVFGKPSDILRETKMRIFSA